MMKCELEGVYYKEIGFPGIRVVLVSQDFSCGRLVLFEVPYLLVL